MRTAFGELPPLSERRVVAEMRNLMGESRFTRWYRLAQARQTRNWFMYGDRRRSNVVTVPSAHSDYIWTELRPLPPVIESSMDPSKEFPMSRPQIDGFFDRDDLRNLWATGMLVASAVTAMCVGASIVLVAIDSPWLGLLPLCLIGLAALVAEAWAGRKLDRMWPDD